ncbi:WHy domain-containing protein [Desulfonema limicola]|uniref:WHy domain-containing protein n=1 Tax=Desulfonema limicola TaxID=45656 RepID=A0A975B5H4_9BACT|nr:LEA type 2 family protein [Desulfonema limicola]QTA79160.1 WHy domain-containing protein [Desulfonema limicola]
MYKKLIFSILITFAITICGCAALQQLIDKPEVKFQGMSLKNISLFEAVPVFKFIIINPNPMGISVHQVTYNLTINDLKFIKGVSDQQTRIKAASSGILELPISFNYMDVFKSASEFIGSDKAEYNLSGSIGIGPFSIPYENKGEFEVPDLPALALKSVKISSLSLKGASIVFDLELENNKDFAIDLSTLDYSIKLDGKDFIKGIQTNISPVRQNSRLNLEIPLELNFFELGTSVYKVFKDSSADYELSGSMKFNIPKIGTRDFPFLKKGKVSLR